MDWRAANMSATMHACRSRGIWRTTRQTDKLNRKFAEETVPVEFRLNGALLPDKAVAKSPILLAIFEDFKPSGVRQSVASP